MILTVILVGLCSARAFAGFGDMYHCDLGIQGGCGYYTGDATPHIFMNVREAYGAFFRYRFTQRWALSLQGNAQRITGYNPDGNGYPASVNGKWINQLVNIDVSAEFNFFRFDDSRYDSRVKPFSPYIGIGFGATAHSHFSKVSGYMPFIIGFKWKFAPRCNLQLAWQHNVYFNDNLENVAEYNNSYGLNGSNIMNNDVAGQLLLGISVAFAMDKHRCLRCDEK